MKGERNMHGRKSLFDGQRFRADRVHPALALLLVAGVMFGQRVAVEQMRDMATPRRVAAVTIDVASEPNYALRQPDHNRVVIAGIQ